jgi:hypothetical protein
MNRIAALGQILQDAFVYDILDGKTDGFFVDIGAGIGGPEQQFYHNLAMSNTFNLEKVGWKGIAIDYDKRWYDSVVGFRKCDLSCADLLEKNINDVLEEHGCPDECTYLSLDVDDAQDKVFSDFNFDKYRFEVITYETNRYFGDHMEEPTERSREKLKSFGYKLLFGGVGVQNNKPIEDWYVSEEIFDKYKHLSVDGITCYEVIQTIRKNK